MAISDKMQTFIGRSSWIRKMFEEGAILKNQYGSDNVFDFSLGNPNLDPPDSFYRILDKTVKVHGISAHGYPPNAGLPQTRAAVADYLKKEHGLPFTGDNVIMTCGAAGALNIALKAVLNPGDEVICPSPYFVEYDFYVDNHQGVLKAVPTREDFSLDIEAVERAINAGTAAMIINSPNNPTGRVYDEEQLRNLARVLNEAKAKFGRPVYLISDEPYRKIVYDGVSVPSHFHLYEHSILGTSYSKDLSLPGERIGYVAVNPEMEGAGQLVNAMTVANRILGFVSAPAMMQRVVTELQGHCVDIAQYRKKRDMICKGLEEAGYQFARPEGAFYLFPRTPIPDDVEFVNLLREEKILAVPGKGFGGPGYIRLAYCVEDRTIENSLPGFRRAMEKAGNMK